jgi:hypothetical protein
MAAYVAALFGVGLLWRRSFLSGLKRADKKLILQRSPT